MEKYVPLVRLSMTREKYVPYTAQKADMPEKAAELARKVLSGADREYLLVLSVDSKCRPQAVEIVSVSTVNAALAEPREIFKHAILSNAVGIILVHNHPSGDCTPSGQDEKMTGRMEEAGKLLGIPVKDHVIIGDGYYSFRENGKLSEQPVSEYF